MQAIRKLSSLVSPKTISEFMFIENYIVLRDYCRPRDHVVLSERAMFLSTVQNQGESDDDLLGRLCEAPRFFKFSEFKSTADAEDETKRVK